MLKAAAQQRLAAGQAQEPGLSLIPDLGHASAQSAVLLTVTWREAVRGASAEGFLGCLFHYVVLDSPFDARARDHPSGIDRAETLRPDVIANGNMCEHPAVPGPWRPDFGYRFGSVNSARAGPVHAMADQRSKILRAAAIEH